jgi:type I restriction enzyme S subunit
MKPTILPAEYLRFWLEFNMETIKSNAGGTTFAEISKSKFRPILAVRPPEYLLSAFTSNARPVFERIASNETEAAILASLLDTLLPKLISGELKAPDPETLGLTEAGDGR